MQGCVTTLARVWVVNIDIILSLTGATRVIARSSRQSIDAWQTWRKLPGVSHVKANGWRTRVKYPWFFVALTHTLARVLLSTQNYSYHPQVLQKVKRAERSTVHQYTNSTILCTKSCTLIFYNGTFRGYQFTIGKMRGKPEEFETLVWTV